MYWRYLNGKHGFCQVIDGKPSTNFLFHFQIQLWLSGSWETERSIKDLRYLSTGEGGEKKRKDRMFSFFLFFFSIPFYFILVCSLDAYFKRRFLCSYIINGLFLIYVCNIYSNVQRACKQFPFVGLFLCMCSFILFWWFFFCILRLCEK